MLADFERLAHFVDDGLPHLVVHLDANRLRSSNIGVVVRRGEPICLIQLVCAALLVVH